MSARSGRSANHTVDLDSSYRRLGRLTRALYGLRADLKCSATAVRPTCTCGGWDA